MLLEREAELAELERLVADATQDRGRLLILEGPAGIGKTSLVRAAQAIGARAGLTVLRATGTPLEQNSAFGGVHQLFDPLLAGGDHEHLLTGPAAPARGVLLGEGGGGGGPHPLWRGLWWVLQQAAPGGALVCLDDAQWLDPLTIGLAEYLEPRLVDTRVAVLVARRTDERTEAAATVDRLVLEEGVKTVRPGPLGVASVSALLEARLEEPVPAAFAAAAQTATAGTPLYVESLARQVLDEQVSLEEASAVPEVGARSIAARVEQRLERLGGDASALATALAATGAGFSVAAALAELSEEDALAAVADLRDAGVIDARTHFTHPIVRAAVEARPGPERLQALRRRAARLLHARGASGDAVAGQLLATDPAGDRWAYEQLASAGLDALNAGGSDAAATYLTRARAEGPFADAQLELALGKALAQSNRPAAIGHLRAGFALGTFDAGMSLFMALTRAGAVDEALATLAAMEGTSEFEQGLMLASELYALGMALRPNREARQRARAALEGMAAEDARGVVHAGLTSGAMFGGAPYDEIVHHARGCWSRMPFGEKSFEVELAQAVAAAVPAYAVGTPEGHELFHRWVAARDNADVPLTMSLAGMGGGWHHRLYGDLISAEVAARASLALHPRRGFGNAQRSGLLARVLLERGNVAEAREVIDDADAREPWARMWFVLDLLLADAGCALAERAPERALAVAERVGDMIAGTGAHDITVYAWRPLAAEAQRRLGNPEAARSLADEHLVNARRFGSATVLGEALRTAGRMHEDPEPIREAVAVLAASADRYQHAAALLDLGAMLRRAGLRAEAREHLREGAAMAEACGADGIAATAREELVVAGAKPRRDALRGRDALTAAEQRVTALAADGATNREIGEQLFLSPKTVETHLRHAFQKLGISRRTELAEKIRARA